MPMHMRMAYSIHHDTVVRMQVTERSGLSYCPKCKKYAYSGLHLRRDSNPCPLADKASALPTELRRLWCQVQGSNPQLPIIKGGLCFQLHQPGSFWLLEDAIVLLYKVMIERQEKWRKFTEISQGLLYVRW